MNRVDVKSSSIRSIGYDEPASKLEVEFHARSVYQYAGVPKALYEQFMATPSKGRFFDQRIKEKFPTTKIR
jgi:hypothetical protein